MKVLFIGEHPLSHTANGSMMDMVLRQVDRTKHDVCLYSETPSQNTFSSYFVPIVTAEDLKKDIYGQNKLLNLIKSSDFDLIFSVGIDIWHHFLIMGEIAKDRNERGYKWGALFPYDSPFLRRDWINWINLLDYPLVYSQFGYNTLKEYVPKIKYFRPVLKDYKLFSIPTPEQKQKQRQRFFQNYADGKFVFGFFGNNQIRKDPQRAIRAFFELKNRCPNIVLYMHTPVNGVFNIQAYLKDLGVQEGEVILKNQKFSYGREDVSDCYKAVDCLLNTSLQEGLSYTLLEAMLTGIPIIAADNTAQSELLKYSFAIPCHELTFIPLVGGHGASYFETRACNFSQLVQTMDAIANGSWKLNEEILIKASDFARKWMEEANNINEVLDEIDEDLNGDKYIENKILFMQHSAAGDVFMTTRCLKGLKERHGGIPLVYMTQAKYFDILMGNPYIDEVVEWEETRKRKYAYVYNPHGEIILPGHWGRNCNSILSDFYWRILHITPDDFFIEKKEPEFPIEDSFLKVVLGDHEYYNICVVHTTGGDPVYRTYKYMQDVCDGLRNKYITIQVGSAEDFPAGADFDLRGKLSFRETAWVISKATIAVTVDSFVSHLCGALGVSQVCLFGSGNANVVKPNQVKGTLICLSPNYILHCKGLGPCSAAVRDCPAKCTGRHDPQSILEAIETIENTPS